MKIKVMSKGEILDKPKSLAGFNLERTEKNEGRKVWIGKEAGGR